jgi:hypothetical protein
VGAPGRSLQFARHVVVEGANHGRLERDEIVVQGVDDQPERDVSLELGRAAVEDEITAILAAPA